MVFPSSLRYRAAHLESWFGERRKRREKPLKNKYLSLAQKNTTKIIQQTHIRSRVELHLEVKEVWEKARERFYRNKLLMMMKTKRLSSPRLGYVLLSFIFI